MIDGILDSINVFDTNKFVIFDIESTGLSYKSDEMIEFAAGRYAKTNFKVDYHSYVHTDLIISGTITRLTGITQAKVKNAPTTQDILKVIKDRYSDCVLVGHNVGFDSRFLLMGDTETFNNFQFLDTIKLAKEVLPGLKDFDEGNYKLATLAKLFGIDLTEHHTTKADITATNYVFAKLLGLLSDPSDIEKFIKKGKSFTLNV